MILYDGKSEYDVIGTYWIFLNEIDSLYKIHLGTEHRVKEIKTKVWPYL